MHCFGLLVPLSSRWSCLLGLGEISTGFALGPWEVSSFLLQETCSCFYKC